MFKYQEQYYYDQDGCFHRDDGPAIFFPGEEDKGSWWRHGELHRIGGSAINVNYYQYGLLHREDGPAYQDPKNPNHKQYWLFGKKYSKQEFEQQVNCFVPITVEHEGITYHYLDEMLHGTDGPAMYGSNWEHWFFLGITHRPGDQPAVSNAGGLKMYVKYGKLDREEGPAIIWSDGSKFWFRKNVLHRDHAPAIEWADGTKEYYINGDFIPQKEQKKSSLNKNMMSDFSSMLLEPSL